MEGVIVNFRRGMHTQRTNQMIVKIEGIDSKDSAAGLLKKKVIFVTQTGKEIVGHVAKEHGNKGALRVRFERGLPGQAIGKKVRVEDGTA